MDIKYLYIFFYILGFVDDDTFKLYYFGVGIFNRIVNNSVKDIILDDMKI